jgi:Fic family protein
MGVTFHAFPPGPHGITLCEVFAENVEKIEKIEHPLLRGVTYSAMAAYHQFYFDANKRTGRFVMNAVLMSHGYEAIVTPASLRGEYNEALRHMCMEADLTPYIDFLLSIYDES